MNSNNNNNNNNKGGRMLLVGNFGSNNSGNRLRKTPHEPLTEADKASWERWAETAFCSLLQNPGYTQAHEVLVREAGLIADTFVNMAKERFDAHGALSEDTDTPNTNVFSVVYEQTKN